MSRISEAEARNILRALTVPDQSIAETADAYGVPVAAVEAFAVRHGWPDRAAIAARLRAPATPSPAKPVLKPPTPTPTQEPTVTHLSAVPEVAPDTLDDLTRRATTPKAKRLAEKAWAALDALSVQVRDDETTQHARDEIARLEKQLADARAALTGTKKTQPPKKPADTETARIRAWARENGIDVPSRGVLPNRVADAYEQAHGGVA